MKLFHHPISASSRRATLVVHHLALPIELVLVELTSKDARTELARVNPNNKVPVLIDRDFVLWEGRAIAAYLCARTPGQTLYPADPQLRADVERWLYWDAAHLSSMFGMLQGEKVFKKFRGGGDPDPTLVATSEKLLSTFLPVLDAALAGRAWLVGDSVTLADLSVACSLMHAAKIPFSLDAYPNLQALMARIAELPAWQKTEPR